MLTYRFPPGGQARVLRLLGVLVLTACWQRTAQAQERRYLFEAGAAAIYQSFGDSTDLGGSPGALLRLGFWLPANFSIEAEGSTASPDTHIGSVSVGVKTASISGLYNLLLGQNSWAYAKVGFGGTRYGEGGSCASSGRTICGTTTMFLAGLGFRMAFTPLLMGRAEALIYPNHGTSTTGGTSRTIKFSNYGINVGLSLMLGSKPIPDSDHDGVLNNRDRCADTPEGAQVDASGCPADNDSDGVANGVDRCPNTAVGATVDASGCPRDSDGDNIADGVDKCPDTPQGVLVDARGCPRDSDGDSIPDGLDRCSDTPKGATVDALGCPGDEDSDGVLDGLDRCPRTPIGANVNAYGCVAGQSPGRAPANPPPADTSAGAPPGPGASNAPNPSAAPPPRPASTARSTAPAAPLVLEGVTFDPGSARLQSGSYVELDSLVKVLVAAPSMVIEIGGHTDDSGTPADNMRLSSLRAEAVRNYLVAKGVPFRQLVARGYGSTIPRTPDTTPRGRAANRRVEIRQLPPGEQ
jgi:outer membrane protein OmpA-like peptidoglycan-associated protein